MRAQILSLMLCPALVGCDLFSSAIRQPDRSRPVARVDLRGHPSRLAATTAEGILFLNPDGAEGPCRVHYFLGADLVTDDGEVEQFGGVYHRANIDLRTQSVPVLLRELTPEDELVALVLRGEDVQRIPVRLATDSIAEGHVLAWPDVALPAGAGIFRVRTGRNAGELQFVGLASGVATLDDGDTKKRYVTFTGPSRLREALATPRPLFKPRRIKHRADGISVRK